MDKRRGKNQGLWAASILLALSAVLLLSACGSTESSPPTSPSSTPTAVASTTPMEVATSSWQTTSEEQDNPASERTWWGARKEIGELYARIQRPVEDTRAPAPAYSEGKKIVVAEVTVTNESAERKSCDAGTFAAYDEKGNRYEPSSGASKRTLPSGDLEPGESMAGFLAFKVPRNATVVRIVWGPLPVFEWVNEWTWE